MPNTNLQANNTKKAPRKKTIMVRVAMASSAEGRYQRVEAEGSGIPKADRPRARRMMLSKCSRAAVVAGEDDSREIEVVEGGIGGETCVARNMWYVWTEDRMKRQERGITGRPRRLMRFWLTNACFWC